jgi:hypothetical protein
MWGPDLRYFACSRSDISENIRKHFPNFWRTHKVTTNVPALHCWDLFFCTHGDEILRNYTQECFAISQVTSWSTTFPTQKGFICQFLQITCSWYKLLHTICEDPIRSNCKRWIVFIASVIVIQFILVWLNSLFIYVLNFSLVGQLQRQHKFKEITNQSKTTAKPIQKKGRNKTLNLIWLKVKIKSKEGKSLYIILFRLSVPIMILNRKYSTIVTSNVTDEETNFCLKLSIIIIIITITITITN